MADRPNNLKNGASDAEELKRYLFYETSEAERGQIEKRFFDDDELFYELLDLENDLTDRYARNELGESDKHRFAASLKKSPERRAKLANANALQSFIKEELAAAAPPIVEEENPDFWSKLTAFFGLQTANFQYAAAAILFLLLVGIGFLIYERQRNAQELVRLRESENQKTAQIERQESALREQLKTAEERERNLQNELGGERGQTEILTEQLERERAEKTRLTRELEALRKQKQLPEIQPIAPPMATVILAPIGGKGGNGEVKTIRLSPNATNVSATLQIPKESVAERFSVRLNSAPLAENIKPRSTKSGGKYITVNFPAKSLLSNEENLLTAIGDDGSRYNFALRLQE
jgi:hypothetical protein